jgi:hypothetical protein
VIEQLQEYLADATACLALARLIPYCWTRYNSLGSAWSLISSPDVINSRKIDATCWYIGTRAAMDDFPILHSVKIPRSARQLDHDRRDHQTSQRDRTPPGM